MYFADLFNSNNLLQHFGGYVKKQKNSNSDEFLFHATILKMGMYKIRALNELCLRQMQTVKKALTVKDDTIFIWFPPMFPQVCLVGEMFFGGAQRDLSKGVSHATQIEVLKELA